MHGVQYSLTSSLPHLLLRQHLIFLLLPGSLQRLSRAIAGLCQ